jgi:hypothetical protein
MSWLKLLSRGGGGSESKGTKLDSNWNKQKSWETLFILCYVQDLILLNYDEDFEILVSVQHSKVLEFRFDMLCQLLDLNVCLSNICCVPGVGC